MEPLSKISNINAIQDDLIPDKIVTKITKVIKSIIEVHSIYLIGMQKDSRSSLYLLNPNPEKQSPIMHAYKLIILIISEEYVAQPKEFMSKVFSKMHESVRIDSIHYTLNEIKYRLRHGDNFLSRILTPEKAIYAAESLLCGGYCYHPKMYAAIRKEWEFRMNRAYYFKDKVDVCDDIYDESARMFLISQSLQQACAALLYVFWEYKSSYYDLNHFLNLCSNFCNSPNIVLPKKSFRSKRVFHALCHAQYNVNFKSIDEVSLEDSNYAQRLCRRFLEKVANEGEKKLQELEPLHSEFNVQ
ncbi:hypothetical protein [Gillisia sp. Hel_I_29]|uniref:hypothetical protein n=1 Tax=Gillisia sp. Hel_I_29 TaxID=1249975 RepID=UPI000552095C|nr:hypothetical protein [Gillisia sp. Hel_I_29]